MAIRLSGNSYGQLLGIWAILHETKRGDVTITKQILKITNILIDSVAWVGSLGCSKPLHCIASQVCTCGEGVDVNQTRLANPNKTVVAWKLWYWSCSFFECQHNESGCMLFAHLLYFLRRGLVNIEDMEIDQVLHSIVSTTDPKPATVIAGGNKVDLKLSAKEYKDFTKTYSTGKACCVRVTR